MARTAVKAELRCLVLYRASLLAEGVARLLQANGPVEVSVVDVQRDDPRQILRAFQPHILIVDLDDLPDFGRLLPEALRQRSDLRVVCLDASSGTVRVLVCHTKAIGSTREFLLQLWEDEPSALTLKKEVR